VGDANARRHSEHNLVIRQRSLTVTEPTPGSGFRRIDLVVAVVSLALLIPACKEATDKVRSAAANSQSRNNLKQMAIAMHGIASRRNGLLPPSAGTFPGWRDLDGGEEKGPMQRGPHASIFVHMLPDIEQDNMYNLYLAGPDRIPDTSTIQTFCAPHDVTNPGVNTALTSYASNAAVFGLKDGGSTRFPAAFAMKGTSNTILFVERYAVASGMRHTWFGRADCENYLYPPAAGEPAPVQPGQPANLPPPQFGVAPEAARNDTAHAFNPSAVQVALADGSARTVTPSNATAWSWACTFNNAPQPTGW
jgi:hypothetical protein